MIGSKGRLCSKNRNGPDLAVCLCGYWSMALIDRQLERIRRMGFIVALKKAPFLDGHYLEEKIASRLDPQHEWHG